MERIAYRPLRRRGAPRLALSSPPSASRCSCRSCSRSATAATSCGFPRVLEERELFELRGANVRTDKVLVVVAAIVLMVALDRFVAGSRLGRGIRATAQDPETAALMGVEHRPRDRGDVPARRAAGRRRRARCSACSSRPPATTSGSCPASRRSPRPCSAASATSGARCSAGCSSACSRTGASTVLGGEWKDVFAFTVLVLVLMFRPTGLLGESLGKARA